MSLEGKVVLITGASRGIGRALARGFADDGAKVVVFGRSEQDLKETTQTDGARFLTVVGDVTSEADVDRLVAATHQRFGHIDVLVNNAGIMHRGLFLERPFKDWAAVIQANLIGLALCTHRVLPDMVERGSGRVINLASRSAEINLPSQSAYSASKAGVINLTQTLAAEIGPPNYPDILINVLLPGLTYSAMAFEAGYESPEMQAPEAVYPHTKFLVTLPAGGPSGRVFLNSKEYIMYAHSSVPPLPKN
jgi:NAD(P)-dependent dehydrogenase (short-subunit alcohol dehydrogenase family)